MSEAAPKESEEGDRSNHPGRTRVRTRVRVRTGPTRLQRLKKWWRKHDTAVLFWGFFILAVLTLFVLVWTGQIRAPAPPPPPECTRSRSSCT